MILGKKVNIASNTLTQMRKDQDVVLQVWEKYVECLSVILVTLWNTF